VVHLFLRLCIVKKLDSIRTKLTEEIDFEVCPYGDSGNGTAAAGRHSAGYSDLIEPAARRHARSKLRGIRNWGRNWAVKTNWLVRLTAVKSQVYCT